MKLILVVVAILGVSNALPAQRGIKDHAADFWALFDKEAVLALVGEYWKGGAFNKIQAYVCSDDFIDYVKKIAATDEYAQMVDWAQTAGIDGSSVVETATGLRALICSLSSDSETLNIADFWVAFKALIPVDEIKALFNDKLENDAEFQKYWAIVTSDTAKGYCTAVWYHEYTQYIVDRMDERGWPVGTWVARIHSFLWG